MQHQTDERQEIAARIKEKYGFPSCLGFIDGTLLPLEFKPSLNGEDYYSRKGCYAINALITCDDASRIRNVVVGWPGSVHDNRVWQTSFLYQSRADHFSNKEYILGDSAFTPSNVLIPSYKKPRGAKMLPSQELFNTLLAKPRVRSEHCIGLLKGRFQLFKRIRFLLKGKKDLRKIINLFTCACILHNWLIEEPFPPEWIAKDDENDEEWKMQGIDVVQSDERRKQLHAYMMEKMRA
jgi:DDE superfamily endonuclease